MSYYKNRRHDYFDPRDHKNYEHLEKTVIHQLLSGCYEYRELDGSGNNEKHPEFGLKEKPFMRKAPARYGSSKEGCALNDDGRENPRTVSNELSDQKESIPNSKCASNMIWLWGQFIDHDITLTHTADDPANIDVPDTVPEDPLEPVIPFNRSASDPDKDNCNPGNPRQQINSLTPFIDASNVYGTSEKRNKYIREFCGGRLKMNSGELPPFNDGSMDNSGHHVGPFFVCGDIRSNEHVGLASIHALFVREHNYWANKLACECPEMCDEQLYQRAKLMVEAEIEAITFNEFLPLLLGECEISRYCYDCDIDPQVTNVFATAAYRFGHSMVPTDILHDKKLREVFFSSHYICNESNIDNILSEFACNVAEEVDTKLIDDLRNFLFGDPGEGGADLAALNIQRGRDHGLAYVNDLLKACGLSQISSFSDVTDDKDIQAKLATLYDNVNHIDIWIFGLLQKKDKCSDSMLGPLFHAIVKDSFLRLRDGDRLWYENRLTKEQIKLVNCTKLSDIIRRNTCVKHIQDDVFRVPLCGRCRICHHCETDHKDHHKKHHNRHYEHDGYKCYPIKKHHKDHKHHSHHKHGGCKGCH
jgi:hypothetical protein